MSVKVVTSGTDTIKVSVETIPAIKVTAPEVSVISVNPNYTTGQPGAAGPEGPQGPAGNDGVTVTYAISAQDGDNSDEKKVRITGSDSNSSDVILEAGTNLSIAHSGDKITFASTVTDAVLESDTSTSGFGFVVDDDTMNSASDTKVPTQQSVKAYVDNNVTSANVTTDITISRGTDTVTVESSDGTDGIIEEATGSKAGVMTVAMHDKLDGIDANADVTDSTSVGNAGAVMDTDFSQEGLMKRGASNGSYSVVADTDGIDEGATNLFYTEGRFNSSLDGSTALRDADFGSAGMMKTDGAGNYSVITPGTGLAFDGSTVKVSGSTTMSAATNASDVELKVTGPSGVESAAITFDAGQGITITESNNDTITIASSALGTGVDELNDLDDAAISGSVTTNDYLVYDGSNFVDQQLDIRHDTQPRLGGVLNVVTHEIQSSGTNDLVLKSVGTGKASLVANDGDVELVATGGGNYVKAKSDVDMTGNSIVTTSNDNDISITPHGTGNVIIGNFEFDADQDLTGKNDYVLTYDSAGGLISLEAASGGGVDTSGTPADDQIAVFTDADTVEGSSGLTYDGSTFATDADAELKSVSIGNQGSSVLNSAGKFDFGSRVTYDFAPSASTSVRGDVYMFKGTTWSQSDASSSSSNYKGLLGVATGTTAGAGIVLQGVVRVQDNTGFSSATAGDELYLDTTAGHVTATKPNGSGQFVRIVGYVIDATNKIIYFDPSKDWLELA